MVILKTRIFNDITRLIKSGLMDNTSKNDFMAAYNIMKGAKAEETAMWILMHPDKFIQCMYEGFEIDNSQTAQLKEINNKN